MDVSLLFTYISNTMGCMKLKQSKALNAPDHIKYLVQKVLCFPWHQS